MIIVTMKAINLVVARRPLSTTTDQQQLLIKSRRLEHNTTLTSSYKLSFIVLVWHVVCTCSQQGQGDMYSTSRSLPQHPSWAASCSIIAVTNINSSYAGSSAKPLSGQLSISLEWCVEWNTPKVHLLWIEVSLYRRLNHWDHTVSQNLSHPSFWWGFCTVWGIPEYNLQFAFKWWKRQVGIHLGNRILLLL